MTAAPYSHPALRALALILLGCYSFVFFQSQVLHPLAHSGHNHELHSEQAEADLCHQAIYHQANESCGHNEHLKTVHLDCEFCDILLSTPEIKESGNDIEWSVTAFNSLANYYLSIPRGTGVMMDSNRGPPSLI